MNIAIISTDFPPMSGGISSWAFDTASALGNSGHQITVLSRAQARANHPFQMLRCWGRSWNKHRAKWVIIGAMRLPPIEIAIFATWDLADHAAPYLKKKGIKVYCAAHGSDLTREGLPVQRLKKTALSIDHWLPVSTFLQQQLQQHVPSAECTVLPYPLIFPKTTKKRPHNAPLLIVSRIVGRKGIPDAADIAQKLKKELWVCGDGPMREKYENSLGPHVRWFGAIPRDELAPYYQQSSAVLLLSTCDKGGYGAEGLGLCLIEGAANGTPTIGTSIGGIPEAIGVGILIDEKEPEMSKIKAHIQNPESSKSAQLWAQENHGVKLFLKAFSELVSRC